MQAYAEWTPGPRATLLGAGQIQVSPEAENQAWILIKAAAGKRKNQ